MISLIRMKIYCTQTSLISLAYVCLFPPEHHVHGPHEIIQQQESCSSSTKGCSSSRESWLSATGEAVLLSSDSLEDAGSGGVAAPDSDSECSYDLSLCVNNSLMTSLRGSISVLSTRPNSC